VTPPTSSRHFRIERVAPGVHAAIATLDGYGLCNSGIVDLGGATVVFDSMLTPMAGAALTRAAERCTGQRPTWVVNSHYHGDHIWGNASFPSGHVVSSRRVRDAVLSRSQAQLDAARREFPKELASLDAPGSTIPPADRTQVRAWFRGVLATPRSHRIVPPEVTFRDELVLEGRRRSLHLITYGGGHSPSDVFGYLPDEGIMFTGDLAMVGYHPALGDGWPDEWIRILGRMRRLRVAHLLPGHGPLGTATALERNRTYLLDVRRTVAEGRRRGATRAEILALPVPERYRRLRFSFMFPENLARTYRLATARRGRTSRRR
jgi:cyclase